MTISLLAEYGRAKTVNFSLVEVDGVDFRVDAADGGDDIKIMKDEGTEASTANNFTDEGQGYAVVLTATEMQAARVKLYVVDLTGTKVWLDTDVIIETFGHQSSAHPNLSPYWTNGAVAASSQTSTVFVVDGFTEATDDHLIGGTVIFTSGVNLGQARPISDYDDTTGTQTITVGEAFIAAPADNDEFVILPRGASGSTDWANAGRLDAILDLTALEATVNALNDISAANVNTEMVDVITVDAISEIAQGVPPATPNLADAVMLLYMALRNKLDIDPLNAGKEIHNNAGTRINSKAQTDTGSVYSEAKMISGA